MIVNRESRWVYAGIPKTASTTLHAYLKAAPFYGCDTGPEEQHRMQLPEGAECFRVLVVVRNPFSRMLSLWRHARLNEFPGISLADLVHQCQGYDDPFYYWRQIDFVRCLPSPSVVRLEELGGGLKQFFRAASIPEIPRLNETDSLLCVVEFTPELIDLVAANYRDDFVEFGYSLTPPWCHSQESGTKQCQLAVRH